MGQLVSRWEYKVSIFYESSISFVTATSQASEFYFVFFNCKGIYLNLYIWVKILSHKKCEKHIAESYILLTIFIEENIRCDGFKFCIDKEFWKIYLDALRIEKKSHMHLDRFIIVIHFIILLYFLELILMHY